MTAPALSAAEAARVAAFGLDVVETVEEYKERLLAVLRLQEQASREEAARIRSHYNEQVPGAPSMSEVIRQEARAGAFAASVELIEGLAL